MNQDFWKYIQQLVDTCKVVIDRPKGSTHPRYPGRMYPVDYGYLNGTNSKDGGGVDIWVGTKDNHRVEGVLCTVDLLKMDTELKIIIDCTQEEINEILRFVKTNQMQAIFIENE